MKQTGWYRQLLSEREGKLGYAREVAVLRFLLAEDDMDRFIAERSLKSPAFGEALNRLTSSSVSGERK